MRNKSMTANRDGTTVPRMMIRIEPEQSTTDSVYKLYIYDDVSAYGKFDWNTWEYLESETSADYFKKKLDEIPETATIELFVNSNGGSVKEGTAIYNQLARHHAKKIAYVDGFAYSVAATICMACDEIVMGIGTSMLIHNAWLTVSGNAKELRKAADDLDALMVTNRKIYLKKAGEGITEEELIQLMEEERILTPEECLQYGFADRILEESEGEEDDETSNEEDDETSNNEDDETSNNDDDETSDDSGKKDDGTKQLLPLHIMMRKQYVEERKELQRQIAQLDEVAASAETPNKNKCVDFFNQFLI